MAALAAYLIPLLGAVVMWPLMRFLWSFIGFVVVELIWVKQSV